ncbi:hypothetical protein KGQ71_02370 [Patescibacteria group bacterium]|nr:hypothetical protein [Patescibacteria group bacterium]
MKSVEDRLNALEERNRRVEADKKWETSTARKVAILLLTYLVIGIFLILINVSRPWINACVPSIGFTLSTLTLGWLKQIWLNRQK